MEQDNTVQASTVEWTLTADFVGIMTYLFSAVLLLMSQWDEDGEGGKESLPNIFR